MDINTHICSRLAQVRLSDPLYVAQRAQICQGLIFRFLVETVALQVPVQDLLKKD